jgi:hypothetical protein
LKTLEDKTQHGGRMGVRGANVIENGTRTSDFRFFFNRFFFLCAITFKPEIFSE